MNSERPENWMKSPLKGIRNDKPTMHRRRERLKKSGRIQKQGKQDRNTEVVLLLYTRTGLVLLLKPKVLI